MSKSRKKKIVKENSEIDNIESELEDESYSRQDSLSSDDDSIRIKKRALSFIVIIALILVSGGLWSVYFFAGRDSDDETETNNSTTTVEQVEYSLSGKSSEEDKKDALVAAQSILSGVVEFPEGKTVETVVEELEDGDTSSINQDVIDQMRFRGEFEDDKDLQTATYQSLIILSSYVSDDGSIEPITDEVWSEVYLDQEAGIAFVPVSAFYAQGSAFSLELVYTDGEWKLAPYSLLNIINLSANLQSSGSEDADSAVPLSGTEG